MKRISLSFNLDNKPCNFSIPTLPFACKNTCSKSLWHYITSLPFITQVFSNTRSVFDWYSTTSYYIQRFRRQKITR
nr:MAG TPA: hypothetical protein [Caudoviricetes sp.]